MTAFCKTALGLKRRLCALAGRKYLTKIFHDFRGSPFALTLCKKHRKYITLPIVMLLINTKANKIQVLLNQFKNVDPKRLVPALLIALGATGLSSYVASGSISLPVLWDEQIRNPALWILDLLILALVFANKINNITMSAEKPVEGEPEAAAEASLPAILEHNDHDFLTKLPNRQWFSEQIDALIKQQNSQLKFSIVLVAIENYHDIYRALGRDSGDIAIKQTAERLQELCRAKDKIAKIDSDMFAFMVLEDKKPGRAESFIRDIQKAMESPLLINRLYVGLNFLAGIAQYPEHGENLNTLLHHAGDALHAAANSVKGYAFYEAPVNQQSAVQLSLISELRHAIARGGLDLFYQPQISIASGKICSVEALLRWNHPEYGYIPPNELIPMAKRNRITQLTLWVLKRAFEDCRLWRAKGFDFRVSINLSVKDLLNAEFPDQVQAIANSSKIQPEWITFEVKESDVIAEPASLAKTIGILHESGYTFCLDKFGAGFSSLAYLDKLPVKAIKIDKNHVTTCLDNEAVGTIVGATINLAHNLGLTVTANGVEDAKTFEKMSAFGCDKAQGYYLSRPLPLADFNDWLANYRQPVLSD